MDPQKPDERPRCLECWRPLRPYYHEVTLGADAEAPTEHNGVKVLRARRGKPRPWDRGTREWFLWTGQYQGTYFCTGRCAEKFAHMVAHRNPVWLARYRAEMARIHLEKEHEEQEIKKT